MGVFRVCGPELKVRLRKTWERKQALVPILSPLFTLFNAHVFVFLKPTPQSSIKVQPCFFPPLFYRFHPPSSCTTLLWPSTLTPPLTPHSFFYFTAAFPPWPQSTIVVHLCLFLVHDCVCQLVRVCVCACWICAFTHVTVQTPLMMSYLRNG